MSAPKMEEDLFEYCMMALFTCQRPYFTTTEDLLEETKGVQSFFAHIYHVVTSKQKPRIQRALNKSKCFSHNICVQIVDVHFKQDNEDVLKVIQNMQLKVSHMQGVKVIKGVDYVNLNSKQKLTHFRFEPESYGKQSYIEFELLVHRQKGLNSVKNFESSKQSLGIYEIKCNMIPPMGITETLAFTEIDVRVKIFWKRGTISRQFPAMHLKLLLSLLHHQVDCRMASNSEIWKFDGLLPETFTRICTSSSSCDETFCICGFRKGLFTQSRIQELLEFSGQLCHLNSKQLLIFYVVATAFLIKERFVEARLAMNTCTNLLRNLISEILGSRGDLGGLKEFWSGQSTLLIREAFDTLLVIPFKNRDKKNFNFNVYFHPFSSFLSELRVFASTLLLLFDPDFEDERQAKYSSWTEELNQMLGVNLYPDAQEEGAKEVEQKYEKCIEETKESCAEVIKCQITS